MIWEGRGGDGKGVLIGNCALTNICIYRVYICILNRIYDGNMFANKNTSYNRWIAETNVKQLWYGGV